MVLKCDPSPVILVSYAVPKVKEGLTFVCFNKDSRRRCFEFWGTVSSLLDVVSGTKLYQESSYIFLASDGDFKG